MLLRITITSTNKVARNMYLLPILVSNKSLKGSIRQSLINKQINGFVIENITYQFSSLIVCELTKKINLHKVKEE